MEKAKFPMPTMTITQGYDMGTHKGAFALDMAGEDAGIDWVLAPFTGVIKKAISADFGNWYWFESLEPVLCANGEVTKLVAMFGHDNELRHTEGDVVRQGDRLCLEGTSGNAIGNHCHMEIGKGEYVGTWFKNNDDVYMLYNAVKPNEYLCVPDDYVIRANGGYEWKKESEVVEPVQYLNLSPEADTWRVYAMDKQPVAKVKDAEGNEIENATFFIKPSQFGGLSYTIQGYTYENVAIIETRDYGQVQIYIGQDVADMYSITNQPLYGLVK